MFILAIGDLHFQNNNMEDSKVFIEKTLKLVEEKTPNFVVILGDILHDHARVHTPPYNLAIGFIEKLSKLVKTFVIIGNHDLISANIFLKPEHAFNALKKWDNVVVVDDVVEHEEDELLFYFCPYVPPGKFIEALNTSDGLWETADCIFAHQEFLGAKMGAIESVHGDVWGEDMPLVISGHIHDIQSIGENIFYTGSAMQHSFGENGNKCLWMVQFTKDSVEYEQVDLELKKKKTLYVNVDKVEELKLQPEKAHIKLAVRGDQEELTLFRKSEKYRELTKLGIKISLQPPIENAEDVYLELKNRDATTYRQILDELISKESTVVQELYKKIVV